MENNDNKPMAEPHENLRETRRTVGWIALCVVCMLIGVILLGVSAAFIDAVDAYICSIFGQISFLIGALILYGLVKIHIGNAGKNKGFGIAMLIIGLLFTISGGLVGIGEIALWTLFFIGILLLPIGIIKLVSCYSKNELKGPKGTIFKTKIGYLNLALNILLSVMVIIIIWASPYDKGYKIVETVIFGLTTIASLIVIVCTICDKTDISAIYRIKPLSELLKD